MQRVTSQISELEAFSAPPSDAELQQIVLVKAALADAGKKVDGMREQVARFNDALNAAKVPYFTVP